MYSIRCSQLAGLNINTETVYKSFCLTVNKVTTPGYPIYDKKDQYFIHSSNPAISHQNAPAARLFAA